ncbi:MAG: rhomboid family intramembrane serine protease [Planctomycetaceae bacterium]
MGIHDREYYRGNAPGSGWGAGPGAGARSAMSVILWTTIVAYVIQLLVGDRVTAWFDLRLSTPPGFYPGKGHGVLSGEVWRLLTYGLLHDRHSPWHIIFNLYILYITGRDFEATRGSREFLTFYITGILVAAVAYLVFGALVGSTIPSIGASGAVNAVFIWYALMHPREIWYILFVIPVPVLWIAVLKIIFDLHPALLQLAGDDPGTGIAHACHLGGVLLGALYFYNNWFLSGWLPTRGFNLNRAFRKRPPLKVHRPEVPAAEFNERVDELLDKVHREGEASLTQEERELLMEASRRARGKSS